jgi:outer membrane receptor for ferrienterochelin and colicins
MAAWTFNLTGPMHLPEVFDLDENGNPSLTARPIKSETWSRHTFQLTKSFKKSEMEIYGGVENLFNDRQPVSPLVGINDPNAPVGFSPYFDTVYAYAPLSGREFYLGVRWEIEKKKDKF